MTRLFVYGTLRPGRAPRSIAQVVATLRPIAAGRVRGRLFDLGSHPGAILDPAAPGFVRGEVVALGAASPPLAWFDDYEGIEPGAPERSAFRRERCAVETDGGERVACWVWVLGRPPTQGRVIASGEWPGRA